VTYTALLASLELIDQDKFVPVPYHTCLLQWPAVHFSLFRSEIDGLSFDAEVLVLKDSILNPNLIFSYKKA